MLALVASIHVLNTAIAKRRRGWSGQARPWRMGNSQTGETDRQHL